MTILRGDFDKTGKALIVEMICAYLRAAGKMDRIYAMLTQLPRLTRLLSTIQPDDYETVTLSDGITLDVEACLRMIIIPASEDRVAAITGREDYSDQVVEAAIRGVDTHPNDHRHQPYNDAVLQRCAMITDLMPLISPATE